MRGTRILALAAGASGLAATALAATQPEGPALPLPPAPFEGRIGESYADSQPDLPEPRTAPKGAPNILVVLTDDVGFGAASTFGGPVPTPHLDRLAARGLVFDRFHTTAMCSPTRAALLTGRNHHAVHNGIVANLTTGFPGYDNQMPKSAATLAEVLRQYGYNTAMFGKHHNTPEDEVSPQGPFDSWPTGLGFETFYGFMAAETNQFHPALYRGIRRVEAPQDGILERYLTDEAIHYVHEQKSVDPDKPFFIYYASGSTHGPLQAPAEWIERFRGRFDRGWDAVRAETVARQERMGLIPKGTDVTPRPEGLAAWDALTPDQKRISARWMEVYAGMLAYQDHQFGRLQDELERMGEADDTLVVFIEGDNGAAAEGGPIGSTDPMANFANGMQETEAHQLSMLDGLGGPETTGNYPYGWSWALDAPNPYVKQYASHLGGVRNGMVVSWPARIRARGIRSQFTHVNDVMPTVLELVGIDPPSSVNGVAQQPIDGVSFAYTFDAPDAPERHDTQYFEMMGNRSIYHDGWLASTTPVRLPWGSIRTSGIDPTQYHWELYDLGADPAQAHDRAGEEPDKLAQMQALFDVEARRNGVYPLDDRLTLARFMAAAPKPRPRYTYWGAGVSVPSVSAAPLLGRSFRVEADLDLPNERATGALLALGGRFGGWSFHMIDGVPSAVMAASHLPGDQSTVTASEPLGPGRVKLVYDFRYAGGLNAGGEMIIRANGEEIGRGPIARTISKLPEQTESLDVGFDGDTPVTSTRGSRPFDGTIERVDVIPAAPGTR